MKFYILASGSKGNATLLEHDHHLLLIDMGIPFERLEKELANIDYDIGDVEAVLFTHEHSDHASGAKFFKDELMYSTEGTLSSRKSNILVPYRKINLLGLDVTPLSTSHDATSPIGFIFEDERDKLV